MEEMQTIAGIVEEFINFPKQPDFDKFEFIKRRIQYENEQEGDLTGYDCRKCRNKGYTVDLNVDGYEAHRQCDCMRQREIIARMERSGLTELLKSSTFENFHVSTQWQNEAKSLAWQYAQNPKGWLYFGGQSGAGKTHLCTAVCNVLIQDGYEVRYLIWRELLHQLESNRFKDAEYAEIMNLIKKIDVLYLDDFMKAKGEKIAGAMEYAFEVINARYNAHKLTIISSEWFVQELADLDEATAGRILQSAGNNVFNIGRNPERNFRMRIL